MKRVYDDIFAISAFDGDSFGAGGGFFYVSREDDDVLAVKGVFGFGEGLVGDDFAEGGFGRVGFGGEEG